MSRCSLFLALVCVLALGCGQGRGRSESTEPRAKVALSSPPGANAKPGFDVSSVMKRVHFSYRQEGALFTGGHSTYGVTVDGARVSVSPVQKVREAREPRRPGEIPRHPTPTLGAPLVLETKAIARGGRRLPQRGARTVDTEGRLVRAGAEVSEKLENGENGVELSWSFAARPAGSGALDVRLRATGLAYAGATEGGLHFKHEKQGLGVRVGHATWIDARNERFAVALRWDGRDIVATVPADVVDGAAYPAVLDPVIGPEVAIDVPVTGPATGSQVQPSVAYSGTNYLVAWVDTRSSSYVQCFATRVSSAGAVLDPNGILVSAPGGFSGGCSVVWDGANYLAVFDANNGVSGRRFNSAGAAVDAVPFLISDGGGAGAVGPTAYNNGTTTFVVWHDYRNQATEGIDIYGARVSGGAVSDASGIAISRASADQFEPRVTYGGGNWLVVWMDRRSNTSDDIYGARVQQSTGSLLDLSGIAISTSPTTQQYSPWPASNGTDYFVAWGDDRNATTSTDIWGARVTAAGVVSDPTGIQLCNDDSVQYGPSVAFNGGSYQVVWTDYRGNGLFGNRVTSAGAILDGAAGASIGALSTAVQDARIFAAGSAFFVAWDSPTADGIQDVLGSRFNAARVLEDAPGLILANSANGQTNADIASDGASRWLVVWQDDRAGSRAIYGARVNATGAAVDATGILLSAGGSSERNPSVAFNGTNFLVVWEDARTNPGIWGARVNPSTGLLDPAGLPLFTLSAGNQPDQPDVTSNGSEWFVAWRDFRNDATSFNDIYAGRVSATGTAVNPAGVVISNATNAQVAPEAAFGGGRYLVVWTDGRSVLNWDLYASRVDSTSGAVLDPNGTAIENSVGYMDIGEYGVAYGGSNFLVAFQKDSAIHAARVSAATGALVGTSAITASGNSQPAVTFEGSQFLVVHAQSTSVGSTLKGTRLDVNGADLDSPDFDIQPTANVTSTGAAVASLPNRSLVAYSRYDSTPGVTADRLVTRLISGFSDGAICSIAGDCASGNCVDGVCCNLPCGGTNTSDCRACSTAAGAPVNGTCATLPSTFTCRAAVGLCDAAETCTGSSVDCPADEFAPTTTVCRTPVDTCDAAETCTGVSTLCPANALAPSTTVCRPSAGDCDVVERCTGSSVVCPADGFAPATTACRASGGDCDVVENCSGSSAACPADGFAPSTTVCRVSAGDCDVSENCTGSSAACPANGFVPSTTVCRASAGDCDAAESCTGSSLACPSDGFAASTTVCRASAGACDRAENCSGSSVGCPADAHEPATHVCRAASGDCDIAETCDGTGVACPTDAMSANGANCDDGDACTVAERCAAGACVGGTPALELAPTLLTFAETLVGTAADARAVTMTNRTNAALEISEIDDSGEFPTFPANAPPFVLGAGASDHFDVGFAPSRSGTRSTTIEVTATSCTFELPVSGVAVSEGDGGMGGEGGSSGTAGRGGSSSGGSSGTTSGGGEAGETQGGASAGGTTTGGNAGISGEGGAAGEGGEAGTGGTKQRRPAADESSGCGCRVVGASPRRSANLVLLAVPFGLALRRRRREREARAVERLRSN